MKFLILFAMIGASTGAFAQSSYDTRAGGSTLDVKTIWANGCEYVYLNGVLVKKTCSTNLFLKSPPTSVIPTPSVYDSGISYGE